MAFDAANLSSSRPATSPSSSGRSARVASGATRSRSPHRTPRSWRLQRRTTMKASDELYRLVQFAKGQPDSRPDVAAGWLEWLTTAELEELMRRAEAGGRSPRRADGPANA